MRSARPDAPGGSRPLLQLVLGSLACVGAGCAGLQAANAAAPGGGKGSFLLIDGGAPSGQARLTGCDRATSDLHAALDQAGTPNTVLIAPTAGGMREALLEFGSNPATPHAVLFCGYAAETGGNIFALGTDTAPHDDLALTAVSIRAFSRVAGDAGGLVLLDLHPVAADGAMAAAAAGALNGAAGAWSGDGTLGGTKLAVTDRQPGDATLVDRATRSGAGTPDAMGRALAHATPAPAPVAAAPTPVVPPVPTAAPKPPAAPPATKSAAAPDTTKDTSHTTPPPAVAATTKPTPDAVAPAPDAPALTQPAPDATAGATTGAATGGAIALAPPPPASVPRPPRPKVHVDPEVRRVQVALLARGLFNGRVNGVNSADTQHAVQHFQAMLGHPVTGQLTADETKQLTGG